MRVLSPIVLAQALLVASRQSDFGLCRALRAQLVRHQHIGCEPCFFTSLRISFTAAALIVRWLHEQVKNLTFVVDRAPEPELLPRDHHGHLIEMPPRRWPRTSTAKFSGEQRPELQNPPSHRLVRDIQRALSEQNFDVAIAERETDIEPTAPTGRRRAWLGSSNRRSRHTSRSSTNQIEPMAHSPEPISYSTPRATVTQCT
jgi:hypothetical protein